MYTENYSGERNCVRSKVSVVRRDHVRKLGWRAYMYYSASRVVSIEIVSLVSSVRTVPKQCT